MKKHNVLVTVNGISKSRAQWAKELGVTKGAISLRESKGESVSSAISGILGTAHTRKILEHYDHAREKHPYFCDRILYDGWTRMDLALKLEYDRKRLHDAVNTGTSSMPHIMSCEMSEALIEIANNNTPAAVEELYDAIAVLLRTIDVLEGRQKLGKPETKGETK